LPPELEPPVPPVPPLPPELEPPLPEPPVPPELEPLLPAFELPALEPPLPALEPPVFAVPEPPPPEPEALTLPPLAEEPDAPPRPPVLPASKDSYSGSYWAVAQALPIAKSSQTLETPPRRRIMMGKCNKRCLRALQRKVSVKSQAANARSMRACAGAGECDGRAP